MTLLLCALVSLFSVAQAQVTVSSETMTLGTYVEGLPDVNAPFEQLNPSSHARFTPTRGALPAATTKLSTGGGL